MTILGIDPGLATTGYAVLAPPDDALARARIAEAGVIRTSPDAELPQRLKTIEADLRQILQDHDPDAMAVEELFFNRNVSSAISVAQARGVVLLAGADLEDVTAYTPLQIKRQLCGHGRANKPQVQAMMQRLLGLAELPKPDDAADALAVALCHRLHRQSGLSAAHASP